MKKVVVLGGTGFLGSHVVQAFARRGYTVEACSLSSGIDARDEAPLRLFLKKCRPEIFVHCAQNGGGIGYNATHPIAVFEDNLQIGFCALRAVVEAGVEKYVNIMGNSTYPGKLDIYKESEWWDGPADASVVASSMPRKANWVQAWAYRQELGFRSIHLVLPNMYGPGDHFEPERSHALGALLRKVYEAKHAGARQVVVWGSGRPVREWLYVKDAAEGIARAAECYGELDILNIGRGEGLSIRELAEMIRELLGWQGEFVYDAARPDGAPSKVFDVSRMAAKLGWRPPTTLREGLRETVDWFEQNHGIRTTAASPSQ